MQQQKPQKHEIFEPPSLGQRLYALSVNLTKLTITVAIVAIVLAAIWNHLAPIYFSFLPTSLHTVAFGDAFLMLTFVIILRTWVTG